MVLEEQARNNELQEQLVNASRAEREAKRAEREALRVAKSAARAGTDSENVESLRRECEELRKSLAQSRQEEQAAQAAAASAAAAQGALGVVSATSSTAASAAPAAFSSAAAAAAGDGALATALAEAAAAAGQAEELKVECSALSSQVSDLSAKQTMVPVSSTPDDSRQIREELARMQEIIDCANRAARMAREALETEEAVCANLRQRCEQPHGPSCWSFLRKAIR
mmetsp:Transcript_25594/g.67929  ORF Transcript_25594/g.67929 Transcript_25594/m.67929 type:complete len:226 (+) Transcript_25594:1747-2424(+)